MENLSFDVFPSQFWKTKYPTGFSDKVGAVYLFGGSLIVCKSLLPVKWAVYNQKRSESFNVLHTAKPRVVQPCIYRGAHTAGVSIT